MKATLSFALAAALLLSSSHACTVFVLTDGTRTLFFNNEDWSNPRTRIWFVPAEEGYYGGAFVGFDDGWGQGGVNTEGLAYDWVAGFQDEWKEQPGMKKARGNSSQRMLETCSTVEQAIRFYQTYREPELGRARILVADRSGASVIIGYKDGKLHVEQSSQCRGFGYGREKLEKMLIPSMSPDLKAGTEILRACRQEGEYATKYSNVFDLQTGDIWLYPPQKAEVRLNLKRELQAGPHYYDIPEISEQLSQPQKPLLNEMKRFFLDEYKPLDDQQPTVTKRVRSLFERALEAQSRSEDYTSSLWSEISRDQKKVQDDLNKLGQLESVTLVGHPAKDSYLYRVEFTKATILQSFTFGEQNRVTASQSQGVEWK